MSAKKKATKITETQATKPQPVMGELVHLDPSQVLIGDNVRYAIKPLKVDALAADILADAMKGGPGVHSPIEVELLTPEEAAENPGAEYKLITGEYRLTAVDKLNEQGAGLKIPAFVLSFATPLDRLDRQVGENNQRENMSYIDTATAIERYHALDVPRIQIRGRFPKLNSKGKTMEPVSNAWINKVLRFLEFPKRIQDLIHNGIMGYQVAVDLLDKPKDKWDAIITNILDVREKAAEKEAKEDERLLTKESREMKAQEREQKTAERVKKVAADLTAATELVKVSAPAVTEASKAVKTASDTAAAAYKAKQVFKGNAEEKAAITKALVDAEVALISVKAAEAQAQKTHDANQAKLIKAREIANILKKMEEDKKNPPAPPAPAAPAPPTPITNRELNRASAAAGASNPKPKPFKAADMLNIAISIRKLSDPNTQKKTCTLGQLLMDCFEGKLGTFEAGVDAQVQMGIAKLLGEAKK